MLEVRLPGGTEKTAQEDFAAFPSDEQGGAAFGLGGQESGFSRFQRQVGELALQQGSGREEFDEVQVDFPAGAHQVLQDRLREGVKQDAMGAFGGQGALVAPGRWFIERFDLLGAAFEEGGEVAAFNRSASTNCRANCGWARTRAARNPV